MRYIVFSKNNPAPLEIDSIGYGDKPESTSFKLGARNLYIIHYVLEGEGCYNGNTVKAGQGFLIYPNQPVYYHGNPDKPWHFLWVISHDDNMQDIYARYNADKETLIFNYDSVDTIKQYAKELVKKPNSTIDAYKILEKYLHILNSHIHNSELHENKSNSDIYTDYCVNYIENNIDKKITVDELTQLLGVSQPYLYKIFREHFDMSVKQYITKIKLRHAKKMLRETDTAITRIAALVGYDDVLTFSKVFKLNEKISPKHYRAKFTQSTL